MLLLSPTPELAAEVKFTNYSMKGAMNVGLNANLNNIRTDRPSYFIVKLDVPTETDVGVTLTANQFILNPSTITFSPKQTQAVVAVTATAYGISQQVSATITGTDQNLYQLGTQVTFNSLNRNIINY